MFRVAILATALLICARPLTAGIVLDGSFGTSGALPGPNYMIGANLGKQVGTNLFQSFNQFNLISSESATFTGPSNVQNILSRVTSGSPSSIDGKVSSQIQGANLFFLNPAGMMFGPHAQLDVSGSVAVSTATYVKMADGGRFNANLGGGDTLTSASVSAFGFLAPVPAPVSVTGSNTRDSNGNIVPTSLLTVAPQKCFSIIAGDIALNGSTIMGPGSRVNLVSVKSAGEAQLDATDLNSSIDVSQFSTMGAIDLMNLAKVDTSGTAGGPVVVRGGSLFLDNSQISSETTGAIQGSPLDIALFGDLSLVNRASIFTNTSSSGAGGNLTVHAGSLLIDGSATPEEFTGISAGTKDSATGNAGDLTIAVDRALSIVGHGQIGANTLSSGNGGNMNIHAGSLLIDGTGTPPKAFTGIGAESNMVATGNAGDITVTVDHGLSILGSGLISAATGSRGKGGNVIIHAGSLSIDGSATPNLNTGITAESLKTATGDAGNVNVTVDQALKIAGHGSIFGQTSSSGKAGNLIIHAGSLSINGAATPNEFTGISVESKPGVTGAAGSIEITSIGTVRLDNHSSIKASSNVNGGNITIKARALVYLSDSEITAEARNTGGNITIDPLFIVLNDSLISANAAAGQGGNINLISSFFFNSGSLVTATGTTNNGTVNITAPQLDLGAELITLPSSLVSAQNQLQERCTALLQGAFSSFISIGRGGTEPEPDELEDASDDEP
jgi:filamentous hemagglutinin family protein